MGCQPGSSESASCATWSVLGSPPLRAFIAWWKEATDPQFPGGGSQRACTHGGCPPHGFWATYAVAVRDAASLGCQPGVRVVSFLVWSCLGSPPFSSRTQSYPAVLEVTLQQRGLTIGPHASSSAGRLPQCGVTPFGGI